MGENYPRDLYISQALKKFSGEPKSPIKRGFLKGPYSNPKPIRLEKIALIPPPLRGPKK